MDTLPPAADASDAPELPGSHGEHWLQQRLGTHKRARAFYDNQVLNHLNQLMCEFLSRQEMMFVSTADRLGNCDCSFRAGPPGFVRTLDERTLAYPEYRGNGVMASLGNLAENPHVALLFLDFFHSTVGLHVNGSARLVSGTDTSASSTRAEGPDAERWVIVRVEEAYIHCSKHIPRLVRLPKDIDWGTDSAARKGGDFFKAKASPAPWKRAPGDPSRSANPSAGPVAATGVGDRIRSLARVLSTL